jgi:5-methylcytosine-specific restriction endonuclease McrA
MQNFVFVLNYDRTPSDPVHPGAARRLLSSGKAAVLLRMPFTIILKEETVPVFVKRSLRLKLDPGSKTTGVALVDDITGRVVFAAELTHRGQRVHLALEGRRAVRRWRRSRHTRYRAPRFDNRRRRERWLPPSLESRISNVLTWVQRLCRYAPVVSISLELVKFDTQLMQDAEVSGVAYQQGELAGYEVREYLLEKWTRTCAYCGKTNVPLEIEHIVPRSRGGSSRVSNLTLACHTCNQRKGTLTAEEFGHPKLQAKAKLSLRDAAAVNATRWALYRRLQAIGLPIECSSGGRTKFNRTRHGYPKAHWIDAACVGESGALAQLSPAHAVLAITACGHGSRQVCRMDRYGFPCTKPKAAGVVQGGFRTGDLVRAVMSSGAKKGTYIGRVAVRAKGNFNITTIHGVVQGVAARYCHRLQATDGYRYQFTRNNDDLV